MSRTLTVRSGGGSTEWTPGWHNVTISKAKYGTYNDDKFLEMKFDGYPDNFSLRVYEKHGKDGEEFAIGQVFRFANAGISEVLEGADGTKVIKLDDDPSELNNKKINIFLYKDGQYSRALSNIAPTVFHNDVEEMNEEDVMYWKGRSEKFFHKYIEPKLENSSVTADSTETEDIPF